MVCSQLRKILAPSTSDKTQNCYQIDIGSQCAPSLSLYRTSSEVNHWSASCWDISWIFFSQGVSVGLWVAIDRVRVPFITALSPSPFPLSWRKPQKFHNLFGGTSKLLARGLIGFFRLYQAPQPTEILLILLCTHMNGVNAHTTPYHCWFQDKICRILWEELFRIRWAVSFAHPISSTTQT